MSDTAEPNEDVLRKIRKLLALAESPNPNEAAAAAAKARKLLLEHGLQADQIGIEPGDVCKETWKIFQHARNRIVGMLAAGVAHANMCRLIGNGTRKASILVLIGRPMAIAAAKLQMDYLYEAMERGAKAASNGRGKAWMNDYRLGWVYAITKRLEAEKRSDTVEERGLVLREDAAVSAYMKSLGVKPSTSKLRTSGMASDAVLAGYADGQRVILAKQLARA